jgi:Plasmid stabilization system protein
VRSIVVTPRAQDDIVGIAAYTLGRWGEAQMARYVDGLHRRFRQLARLPDMGRLRKDVGPQYRSIVQGSHVIFYRVTARDIVIVRVLHGRMSAERHLS